MILKDYNLTIGDCICTYNGSWLNRKIFWFSKWRTPASREEKIAHVGMYIGDDKDGNPQIFEADWQGTAVNSGEKYDNKKYKIHVASPIGAVIDDYHIAKLRLYIKNTLDDKYAFSQLAAIACKKIFGLNRVGDWDKDAVICSELYCRCIRFVWDISLTDNPAGITPMDIYFNKNMEQKKPDVK